MTEGRSRDKDFTNELTWKWWNEAIETCEANSDRLSNGEKSFLLTMREATEFFGRDAKVTHKQFEWMRGIASEVESR